MRALFAMVALWLGAVPAIARSNTASVEAIWLRQVVNFEYRSGDTTYSCRILQQKVAGMLQYLGARNAEPSDRMQCADFAGIVKMQIALESPTEATPENLSAVTDYATEDMLAARLRGEQLPTVEEVRRFPAAWTTLSLRDSRMQLTSADCELVRQLRRQVFPKLSVQILEEPARCGPALARGRPPAMKVRALIAAG